MNEQLKRSAFAFDRLPLGASWHGRARDFWERPVLLTALVLLAAVPLIVPAVPPLVDTPGHISHYHIERTLPASPDLRRFYGFQWALIGNLGVDLLIVPVAALFGVELATKLIVMLVPMLTVAGLLVLAREIHGRIPPTSLFALPLAYSFPFQFGFLNFSLSVGLCFLCLALWLRLGRAGHVRLRATLFVPLATLLWVCHTYGWGLLGVFVFAAELSARRDRGRAWPAAALRAAQACLPLFPPFLLMLLWQGGEVAGETVFFFEWRNKVLWLMSILREDRAAWDMAGAALLLAIALVAVRGRDLRLAPPLKLAVALLGMLYLLLPRVLIGSGYADMRLAPIVVAAAIVGIMPEARWSARKTNLIAAAALALFVVRLAGTTLSFVEVDRAWRGQLEAVDHLARGSRVLTLTEVPCDNVWAPHRTNHLNSLAVVRRDVFTNAQWAVAGAQMLKLRYSGAGQFDADPSHLIRPASCSEGPDPVAAAVDAMPGAFDYLWLIEVPAARWPSDRRLVPLWRGENAVLYRVAGDAPPIRRRAEQ